MKEFLIKNYTQYTVGLLDDYSSNMSIRTVIEKLFVQETKHCNHH